MFSFRRTRDTPIYKYAALSRMYKRASKEAIKLKKDSFMHNISCSMQKKQKTPLALFKLDIKKAFGTISWDFTLQVKRSIGFPLLWVSWVKQSVLQGLLQVLINGILGKKNDPQERRTAGGPPLAFTVQHCHGFLGEILT